MKSSSFFILSLLACLMVITGCQTTSGGHKSYVDQMGAKKAYVAHTPVPGSKPADPCWR